MPAIFFWYPPKEKEEKEERTLSSCRICGGKTVRDETTGLYYCDKCRVLLLD